MIQRLAIVLWWLGVLALGRATHELFDSAVNEMRTLAESLHHRVVLNDDATARGEELASSRREQP